MQKKHNVEATFILGDLTDKKDYHSSRLVNQIVEGLTKLKPPVYILRGNHDGLDPGCPYFKFLGCIEGVEFIIGPQFIPEYQVAMIPHQPDQKSLEEACALTVATNKAWGLFKGPAFAHQCLTGAISETGKQLTGLKWPLKGVRTYAGDIHRPQTLDCGVTYVGAPYHIRFGDDYTPRVLLLGNGNEQNLYFDAPRKWVLHIHSANDLDTHDDLRPGDHVRIFVELGKEELVKWAEIKKMVIEAAHAHGLEVYGVDLTVKKGNDRIKRVIKAQDHEEVYDEFCKAEKLPETHRKAGAEFLNVQHRVRGAD